MSGNRVVSTLSSGALDGLDRELNALGATLMHQPLLTFETAEFGAALSAAVSATRRFQGVVLTSPRSAGLYARAVDEAQVDSPPLWASGPATARELQHLAPVHVADSRGADGAAAALARMMIGEGVSGPILFPCGEQHRDALPGRLRAAGIEVVELVCYRAVMAPPAELRAAAAGADVIIVGSGRVAEALAEAVPAPQRPVLLAIGPVTAQAAASAGWTPAAIAHEPTTGSLLEALHGMHQLAHGAPR
jgi:uroporphyrinogen-III synthase